MLDFYENLLTDHQKEVMDYYYREDYSLNEISEILKISKSAVSDLLKRVESTLRNYESKLELVRKHNLRTKLFEKINDQTIIEELMKIEEGE